MRTVSPDALEAVMKEAQRRERELRSAGQKEYAHSTSDALANFKRVGEALNLPPEKVLAVYLLKHIDGILAWVNGHRSQREPVLGRIDDARVYLVLLAAMKAAIEENDAPTS